MCKHNKCVCVIFTCLPFSSSTFVSTFHLNINFFPCRTQPTIDLFFILLKANLMLFNNEIYFYLVASLTCDDPGFISNGYRRNMDGTESTHSQTYEEGESVVYGCRSRDYALQGPSILACQNDGKWSEPLPQCIKATGKSHEKET